MRSRRYAQTRPTPLTLTEAAAQFEAWRCRRPRGERIPAELWDMAVELARGEGVSCTSQTLHLDYYALQRRLGGSGPPRSMEATPARSAEFVEVSLPPPTPPPHGPRCQLEVCDPGGNTMRAEVSGMTAHDLATLLRVMMEKTPCSR